MGFIVTYWWLSNDASTDYVFNITISLLCCIMIHFYLFCMVKYVIIHLNHKICHHHKSKESYTFNPQIKVWDRLEVTPELRQTASEASSPFDRCKVFHGDGWLWLRPCSSGLAVDGLEEEEKQRTKRDHVFQEFIVHRMLLLWGYRQDEEKDHSVFFESRISKNSREGLPKI